MAKFRADAPSGWSAHPAHAPNRVLHPLAARDLNTARLMLAPMSIHRALP
jgi:hypothetical protein